MMNYNVQNESNEIMTLAEVAEYLHLAERTVLRMAQKSEIPAAKIASQWRFIRSVVRDWVAAKMQTLPAEQLSLASTHNLLTLGEVVREDLVNIDITAGPKQAVLKQLVEPLTNSGIIADTGVLLESLIERERLMTTAVGHGIAIPHPRKPVPRLFAEPFIVIGVCREGTNFDAIDDLLVRFFFLICATREEIHLQLMAKIAWLAGQSNIKELLNARSPKEVIRFVENCEGRLKQKN